MAFKFLRMVAVAAPLLVLSASVWAQKPPESGESGSDPVVARVNGVEIHRSDVVAAQQMLPDQYRAIALSAIYPALLNQMINTVIAAQAARAQGLDKSEDVKRRLANIENRILEDAYVQSVIAERVTEAALQERYKSLIKESGSKEEIRARHILLATEAEAVAIIKQLDGGADFGTLAREKSTGPSGPKGGDLGFFSRGDMVKPFADAAFGLENGKVTEKPVQTRFGWHVIKVEDRRTSAAPSFDETRDQLGQQMSQEVAGEAIADLRKKAEIEQFGLDGKPTPPAPGGIRRVP